MTVDLDARAPPTGPSRHRAALHGHQPPADGCTTAGPTCPACASRSAAAAQAGRGGVPSPASTRIDRTSSQRRAPSLGIVTAGKAHHDFMEVLRRLATSTRNAAGRGRRARLQAGPGVSARSDAHALAFAQGLTEVLVIEEKAPVRRAPDQGAAVLQRPGASARGWSARPTRRGSRCCQCAGRAAPVAADHDRGRLAGAASNPALDRRDHGGATSPPPRCWATRPTRCAPALLLLRLPAQHQHEACPRAHARWPASAATSWPTGWSAAPRG
jgi:hypothetical protein